MFSYFSNWWFDIFGFTKKPAAIADPSHDYFESTINEVGKPKYPVIFHENYDIRLWGLSSLLGFDCYKWGKTHKIIKDHFKENFSSLSPLGEANENLLLIHHKPEYVKNIHDSNGHIAFVAEQPLLYWYPNYILRDRILLPFKWHISGTVLAFRQAMLHGAAVNLGGGFHHASQERALGFNFFSDIWIAIRYIWKNVNERFKFLIIDLNAHQGEGHEWDKNWVDPNQRKQILILDMYNAEDFHVSAFAKSYLDIAVPIKSEISTKNYLKKLKSIIEEKRQEVVIFKPDLVIYIAGTNIVNGDQRGQLEVSEKGAIERDELIFQFCKDNDFPIVCLMSCGSHERSAEIFAASVINLINLDLIKPINENMEVCK